MTLFWCIMAVTGAVGLSAGFWQKIAGTEGQPPADRPSRQPRQPADISPFTAGLIGAETGPGGVYRPDGVTAVTPAGTKVIVSCPHLTGHRSPELAVRCAEREKQRIEKYGR